MTEEEARDWLAARFPSDRLRRLEQFVGILLEESERQSLIARSTFASVWGRHIVDSAQLVELGKDGLWIDIGSGGGLPGIVIACLRDAPILLVEPRRKRADFLTDTASRLGLTNTTIYAGRVQNIVEHGETVTARAVAPIETLFDWTAERVSRETTFVLQRGAGWQADIASAKRSWHGMFHVKPSVTDSDARIVVATEVARR